MMIKFEEPMDEEPFEDFFERYNFDDRMKEFEEK